MTTEGVQEILSGYVAAAAVGAALEMGLCHALAANPRGVEQIAREMGVPLKRCKWWLEYLVAVGLLEHRDDAYALSAAAQVAVVDAYSPETWALLAAEARERYPAGEDLVHTIRLPGSVWDAIGHARPSYVDQMIADRERARRFTHMLYELHQPVARELAATLDLQGVNRLLDLGGGSGVVSLALLRRAPELVAVVVDVANVCAAGREIADRAGFGERITYHAADFVAEDLPTGFDMLIECDVGVYTEPLFRKLARSLSPGGRFVIVDQIPSIHTDVPVPRQAHAFWASLGDPEFTRASAADLVNMLARAGFSSPRVAALSSGEVVIEARV